MSGISSTLGAGGLPPTSIPVLPDASSTGVNPAVNISALSSGTTSASTQTALNITGSSGVLEYAALDVRAFTITSSLLKITIDNVVIYNETTGFGTNEIRQAAGSSTSVTGGQSSSLSSMPFNSSCKIEFASDGSGTATCYYRYYLT